MPTVLIVDDEAPIRTLMAEALADDGYTVATAGDGSAALRWLTEHQPDLIVLDLVMMPMDGATFCRQLRVMPGGAAIPVLICTALAASHIPLLCGTTAHLSKPFVLDQLLAAVARGLSRP